MAGADDHRDLARRDRLMDQPFTFRPGPVHILPEDGHELRAESGGGVRHLGLGLHQIIKGRDGAARLQPFHHIALGRQGGQVQIANTPGNGRELGCHQIAMLLTGLVIVGQNDDISALKIALQPIPPFAGAHRVRGGREAERGQRLGGFFTFNEEDDRPPGDGFLHIGQPVGHHLGIFEVPDPLARMLRVRPALAERLFDLAGLRV